MYMYLSVLAGSRRRRWAYMAKEETRAVSLRRRFLVSSLGMAIRELTRPDEPDFSDKEVCEPSVARLARGVKLLHVERFRTAGSLRAADGPHCFGIIPTTFTDCCWVPFLPT